MSPMHPRLRRALLEEPLHRSKGLTSVRLQEYEGLLARLFYLVHYPGDEKPQQQKGDTPEDLLRRIREFQERFMPNYRQIHERWAAAQQRRVLSNLTDIHPGFANLRRWIALYLGWALSKMPGRAHHRDRNHVPK